MDPLDIQYWMACARFMKFGAVRMKKLYSYFPTMQAAWEAAPAQLALAGIEHKLIDQFIAFRPTVTPYAELEAAIVADVHPITIRDADYPPLLREIYDAPALLFVRGNRQALRHEPLLAVVGARLCSEYGQRATKLLVEPLARNGVGIVSGLALGTDGNAHRAALDAGGMTIAVLGSGVDDAVLYPRENLRLAHEIIEHGGALISEFPIGTLPQKFFFPMRNRIISGMCRSTLIIEAAASSGALITAYSALDQNRDVWAVPGPITSPTTAGTHELLRKGAQIAVSADDILVQLEISPVTTTVRQVTPVLGLKLTDEESVIRELLGDEPLPLDLIVERSGKSPSVLAPILLQLELKGAIKQVHGSAYIRSA